MGGGGGGGGEKKIGGGGGEKILGGGGYQFEEVTFAGGVSTPLQAMFTMRGLQFTILKYT